MRGVGSERGYHGFGRPAMRQRLRRIGTDGMRERRRIGGWRCLAQIHGDLAFKSVAGMAVAQLSSYAACTLGDLISVTGIIGSI